jgi:hypothetical protein
MNMKFLFVCFVICQIANAQSLKQVSLNESIKVSLPETFLKLDDGEVKQSYKSYRKPIAIFRDSRDMADFGANIAENQWAESDLDMFAKFQKSTLRQMFNEVRISSEGFEQIRGRRFTFFEFESELKPDDKSIISDRPVKKYFLIYYTIINSKVLVFQFNCPLIQKDKWRSTAKKIMNSIVINKSGY